jgi:uncharacterized protein YegP (UPF0339 family)
MSDSDFKFVVFRDVMDGYRWRLRSATGETVELSERGFPHKDECVQEVRGLIDARYPRARVRDATIG